MRLRRMACRRADTLVRHGPQARRPLMMRLRRMADRSVRPTRNRSVARPAMIETPAQIVSSVTARVRETAAANSQSDYHQLTFRAMSTPVRISFLHPKLALAAEFQRAVVEWVAGFEARYSRFIPQSIVGQINATAGDGDWRDVDEESEELLRLCD